MLRPAILAALLAAPAIASAQTDAPAAEASALVAAVDELVAMGPAPAPAFGIATPFFTAQLIASADGRWFDRGWAGLELVLGVLGSSYSGWLLSGVGEDAGMVTSYSYGAALAMNLRLVTHGALSWALFTDGVDARAARLVPSIAVTPLPGGAVGTATWAI
jgi:hypothetical protein